MILSGYFVKSMQYSWFLIMFLMALFFILIGRYSGQGRWDKILIDNRNQMSLSRGYRTGTMDISYFINILNNCFGQNQRC